MLLLQLSSLVDCCLSDGRVRSCRTAIQRQPLTSWLTHENVFAKELGFEGGDSYSTVAVDELNGFVSSIKNGGVGLRSCGTFVANPKP